MVPASAAGGGGTPGYTYSWTPSGNAATANGLAAGTYTVTVTDSRGCTMTANVTLTQPAPIVPALLNQSNVTCNGGNNGSVSATANGGSPGYTYQWAPSGGNSSTASEFECRQFYGNCDRCEQVYCNYSGYNYTTSRNHRKCRSYAGKL